MIQSIESLIHQYPAATVAVAFSDTATGAHLLIRPDQRFHPASVPAGVSVAHKTGWNPQLYHDAAIVLPKGRKPYILVVMTQGIVDEHAAYTLVAAISHQCYKMIAI